MAVTLSPSVPAGWVETIIRQEPYEKTGTDYCAAPRGRTSWRSGTRPTQTWYSDHERRPPRPELRKRRVPRELVAGLRDRCRFVRDVSFIHQGNFEERGKN